MYSPKIKEELIPKIYQIAKAKGLRMTTLVNEILQKALNGMEGREGEGTNKDRKESVRSPCRDQGRDSDNPALD